jgi:glycine oxidase
MSNSISIIGCGIIGATIAYELSRSTACKIDVYDTHQPAQAATGAALGVLMGIISQKVKGRAWNLRRDSIRRYQTLIPELQQLAKVEIPHNAQGIVKLLSPEEDLSKWQQLVTTRTEQEWQLELWNARNITTQLPQISHQFRGTAVYSPQDFQVDPVALTNALIAAIDRSSLLMPITSRAAIFSPLTAKLLRPIESSLRRVWVRRVYSHRTLPLTFNPYWDKRCKSGCPHHWAIPLFNP